MLVSPFPGFAIILGGTNFTINNEGDLSLGRGLKIVEFFDGKKWSATNLQLLDQPAFWGDAIVYNNLY